MATCADCVHVEACHEFVKELAAARGLKLGSVEEISAILQSDDCEQFKDRARFVELPCKVGDIVYRICPVERGKECSNCPWEYCECYDIGFQKDRCNSIRKGKVYDLAWLIKRMPYFGKIYFCTPEEAEQALKES